MVCRLSIYDHICLVRQTLRLHLIRKRIKCILYHYFSAQISFPLKLHFYIKYFVLWDSIGVVSILSYNAAAFHFQCLRASIRRQWRWSGVSLGHLSNDDVIKWKHFPRNWPFVREIHRSPVNFPHKGQWPGALMFSLIYAWINDWVNNREAGDLRRQHGHYDVIVMLDIVRDI